MTKKITLEKLARMIQSGFTEVKTEISDVKKELKTEIKEIKDDVKILKSDVKELKLTTQRIETKQEAESLRHDRHSVLIVDHEKRINQLEKV